MAALDTLSGGATFMGKIGADLSSVAVVGLDLAKHVFQVHAIDCEGRDCCQGVASQGGSGVRVLSQPSRPLSHWVGSLWFGPLLGARIDRTRP